MKNQNNTLSLLKLFLILSLTSWLSGCGDSQQDTKVAVQSHLERSSTYQDQGQYRAAILEARNIIKKDQANPVGYNRLAELYIKIGDFKGATDLLKSAPAQTAETHLTAAEAYLGQRKYRSADTALSEYKNLNGDTSTLTFKLASIKALAGKNEVEEAESQLLEVIQQTDNNKAKYLLTSLYFNLGKKEEAIKAITNFLKDKDVLPETLYIASQIAYLQNNLSNSEEHLTEALLKLPETDIPLPLRSKVLRQLSTVLTEQGRTTEALVYNKLLSNTSPEEAAARAKSNQAMQALQEGNIEKAEQLFTELNQEYPSNDMSALFLGLINYEQGDFNEADQLFSGRIDTELASPRLIKTSVLAKLRLNKNDEAFAVLEEALKIHPKNERLLSIYGMAQLQTTGKEKDGIVTLEKSLAINTQQPNLRLALAQHYLNNSQTKRAVTQLELAKKLAPNNINIIAAYAQGMLQTDNKKQADNAIQKMLDANPDDMDSQNLSARYAATNGNKALAKKRYESSLAQHPKNSEALLILANIEAGKKNTGKAIEYFQRYINENTQDPRGYKGVVAAYEVNNQPDKGIKALINAVNDNTKNPTAAAVTAEYFLRKNNMEKALEYIEVGSTSKTTTDYYNTVAVRAKFEQARLNAQQANWSGARKSLLEAISLSPNNQRLYNALIQVEINSNRLKEAEKLIAETKSQFSNSLMPIIAEAKLYVASGDKDKALKLLQNQWQSTPRGSLAIPLLELIDDQQRSDIIAQWLAAEPENPEATTIGALDAQNKGDISQAIALYEKSDSLSDNNVVVLNNLAWLYFEVKNDKAEATAKRAYDLASESSAVLDTYGWILFHNGKIDQARALLEKAASLAPDSKDIQQHLDTVKRNQ